MTLTEEERKAKRKEYNLKPEVIAKRKESQSTPEYKAKQKERESTPEYKAKRKEYQSRPEIKAREKERRSKPENKAKQKERNSTPEQRAKQKERSSTPEAKAKRKEYQSKPENKAKQKEIRATPEYKAKRRLWRQKGNYRIQDKKLVYKIRLKVLQYYSKQLSKSDIPCCRCCGDNFHIDFLALDHIAGRRKMDSESELLKLGYSSLLLHTKLMRWIIKNNFPKGFQILCHNCNVAKGYGKNKNKCPHEK